MTSDRRHDAPAQDAAVDAAWRKGSDEEPSARLDAAIIAAARAAVRSQPAPRTSSPRWSWWTGWQPLAAAAGVAGLAFVLVQMIPREQSVPAPTALERMPQTADSTLRPDSGAAGTAEGAVTPASPPAPAQNTVGARESAQTGVAAARSGESTAMAEAAPPGAAASALPSPDAWASRIAALHASGHPVEAATELSAFRQAYAAADDYLPESLRPWAASVPRPGTP
jgi:hypothetical protein